jgi:hypothetical protein
VLCVADDTARAYLRLAESLHLVVSSRRETEAGLQSLRWYSYNTNTFALANEKYNLKLEPSAITERIEYGD